MGQALDELKNHLAEIEDVRRAERVLDWDQQTQMPPGGGLHRAEQTATLHKIAHSMFASEKTKRLLDEAGGEVSSLSEEADDYCLVHVTRREYERSSKLPDEFVAAWSKDASLSSEVWRAARPANDFAAFRPHLEKMVDYARRAADYFGYQDHPYDALLEGYEPELKTVDVDRVFAGLRVEQVALVKAIAGKEAPRADFLSREYPIEKQKEFGLKVAQDFGYDLRRGRLDIAPHPFETAFGRDDVRITTRYDLHDLKGAIFGIWHETGHALYEQNTSPALARTPLANGCSNVFHESQSRLWENVIGRSRSFWEHYFPLLKETFPEALKDINAEEFYRAVNRVAPSLIRVEADEVTYNLHIMLRFDLEKGLIEGSLKPEDLPGLWHARMQEYVGISPPDDRDGVMQDIHWSGGSFGYFPTYALGNVMGAQIYRSALKVHPEIEGQIQQGEFSVLLNWLQENVYQNGKKFLPRKLALRVNGEPLDSRPYLEYLKNKFSKLYNL